MSISNGGIVVGGGGGIMMRHPTWRRSRTPSALDEPLPVASIVAGRWQARRKIHRTPRRLATLMTTTATSDDEETGDSSGMLLAIAGDEYILVANTVSNICVYRLTVEGSSPTENNNNNDVVSPWATVCLTAEDETKQPSIAAAAAPIVSLVALPFGKSLIYGEDCRKDECHVVAFSDDGQGFILRIRKNDNAIKLYEFSTMNFGVSCVSVVPTVPGSEVDCQLLVGYQTGYLENWKIFRFSTEKIMAKLLWRGVYPNSSWIQNISPLNLDHTTTTTRTTAVTTNKINANGEKENTDEDNKNKKTTAASDHSRYLLVTLLPPKHPPVKTSAMLEVIDIGSLPNDWKHNNKEIDTMDHGHGHLRAIDLGTRWIMPQAGMEILNSNTISTNDDPSIPRRAHFIPSTATGSICSLPGQGNCAALPDGTIAIISSRQLQEQQQQQQDELQWGIANDYNQLLLPYPAIGCAGLNWNANPPQEESSSSSSCSSSSCYRPHVACCLRGGSTYLIPFVPPENESTVVAEDEDDDTLITVFTLDAETHSRYIQSFTAGNLILSSAGDNNNHSTATTTTTTTTTTTPVLLYGWAGGIIDVFSCELMPPSSSSGRPRRAMMVGPREMAALEELVANGSVKLLADVLSALEETNPLLQQKPEWRRAWEESKKETLAQGISTAKDLLLPKFSGVRTLLLMLSSTTTQTDAPEQTSV